MTTDATLVATKLAAGHCQIKPVCYSQQCPVGLLQCVLQGFSPYRLSSYAHPTGDGAGKDESV